jgi:transposase InsO family protein
MRRGRRADLRGLIERRAGSIEAKRRLALVLETFTQELSVLEAASALGLGEARLHRLRERVLEAGIEVLEPRRRGRPKKVNEVDEAELRRLREENASLRRELKAAEVRLELAAVIPKVVKKNASMAEPPASALPVDAPEPGEEFPCRRREWLAKSRAVDFKRFVILEGGTTKDAARDLRLCRRTLLDWERKLARGVVRRGRPRRALAPETLGKVEETIERVGPTLGLEPLKALFPQASRRALREILLCYRERYGREKALEVQSLTWLVPGMVWAMDHTERPGERRQGADPIFALRDLASAKLLLWLRSRPTSLDVLLALEQISRTEGLPLVIKSDNGSAFASAIVRAYLESRGVTLLLSPPRRPRYNGAIEASIRWLKCRTEHQARRLGIADVSSVEVLEEARRVANALPRSAKARAPESTWETRPQLTEAFRNAFRGSIERERALFLSEAGHEPGEILPRSLARRLERQAITRALVAHGILQVRRKRIPLPIKTKKCAKIS